MILEHRLRACTNKALECEVYAPFTREQFHVEPYRNRTDRPRVYTGTGGAVPYRAASGTRTGPSRK